MSGGPISIITSGAYIDQELAAEFGVLPPAFLPVGIQRLYELQVASLRGLDGPIYLTLPASMEVDSCDADRLEALGVIVLPSPDELGLGEALLRALALIGFEDRPIRILHGDTYIEGLDTKPDDVVSTAAAEDGYGWATVTQIDKGISVQSGGPSRRTEDEQSLSGYFALSSTRDLARALAMAHGDFIEALNVYNNMRRLAVSRQGRWLDFGHVQTFFRSRQVVSTARAFNQLTITELTVEKRSDFSEKLKAEAAWLSQVPASLRPYCVRLLDEDDRQEGYAYKVDYEYLPTLSELYVFGRLNRASWLSVLSSCKDFLDKAAATPVTEDVSSALRVLAIDKTRARLQTFARDTDFDLDRPNRFNGQALPSLNQILNTVDEIVSATPVRPAVMHGDFCFSNILYGFRMRRIRLIDPRGYFIEGQASVYGDTHYDVAKLMHSILGRYDMLVAGRYAGSDRLSHDLRLEFGDDGDKAWLEGAAAEMEMGGVTAGSRTVLALVVTLFMSMLPLHSDHKQRQVVFIATALRLFSKLLETS